MAKPQVTVSASRLVVIGGGISGLAAAVAAKNLAESRGLPLQVDVVEASQRLGGLIRSEWFHDCLLEHGPDAVLRTKPAAEALCQRIGLTNEIEIPRPSRGFFVLHRGKITPLPDGFRMVVPTRLGPLFTSRLFSPLAALRLCLEPMIPARKDDAEESLGAFIRRRLGRQVLERVVQPMLSSIYLGDADRLSADLVLPQLTGLVRKYGSLSKGFKNRPAPNGPMFFTLDGGMERLVAVLANCLRGHVHTGFSVDRLTRDAGGGWTIHPRQGQPLRADRVIVATPGHVSSNMLGQVAPDLARKLSGIDYASCMTFHLIYQRDQVAHPLDINGFFVPRTERQPFLAAMSIGTKYPSRVPDHLAAIRVFVGGMRQMEWLEKDPDTLADIIHHALTPILGLRGKPTAVHLAQHPLAMPQLNVGMQTRLQSIQKELDGLPGLFLAGGPMGAVGLPGCIQSGETAAENALAPAKQPSIPSTP